ncbi:broad specificity phosphatase PhoE [Indivirus ILV1]|uniref:Broad specificity phosphatase PhoE n=1 Tax=Indivirus ILV1 TaxID=1977633 RepID=A0A1V0SCT6_9VIRU|nr:broad specificity phosphatase PhoE [Indivirus ILV1]
MIVYIRHANDDGHNTKYKHDPHITKEGIHNTKKIVKELIYKYGYPKEIYYSPFRRCIETMKIIMQKLKNKKIRLVCDTNLSRYFTESDKKKPRVSSKTLKYKIPIYENKKEFHQRIDNHLTKMAKKSNNVWCITHALVYKNISEKLKIHTNPRIDFLEHFSHNVIDDTVNELIPMTEKFSVIKNNGKLL